MAKCCGKYAPLDAKYYMPVLAGLPALPEHLYEYFGLRLIRGDRFGAEYFSNNLVSDQTLRAAKAFKSDESKRHVCLGLGGASGFHEMPMARYGFDATIVDCTPERETVALRNEYLAVENESLSTEGKSNGILSLCEADLCDVDGAFLEKLCDGGELKAVMAYNVFHYLKKAEVANLIGAVAEVAADGAVFSVEYVPPTDSSCVDGEGFYYHKPRTIVGLANKANFKVEHVGSGIKAIFDPVKGFMFRYRSKDAPSP